jgi:curli production assembly/transport component CsgG
MHSLKKLYFVSFLFLLTGCGAYFNQPVSIQNAEIGEPTPASKLLKNLPKPKDKIVVGVYKFRDQTGQYKPTDVGSTFSTAVTQGATSILIKALEDSKWFTPIERENLGNLLNERNIIRSTRQEYLKNANPDDTQLTPLLYAGVLIEGGIVSYDSNVITGGFGARYFGAGGSTKYRQDRVTIYLRLVSTANGEILKTIYISKSILSQAIDASLFRYVNFKRLLEVETGYTKNEPMQMAVTEAIEKGVESLVLEGIQVGIWNTVAEPQELQKIMDAYQKEETTAENSLLYRRQDVVIRKKSAIEFGGGLTQISGDFENPTIKYFAKIGAKFSINSNFKVAVSAHYQELANKLRFREQYATAELNLEYLILPKDKFCPYIYGGVGAGTTNKGENSLYKFQFGAGFDYMIRNNMAIRIYGEQNMTDNDLIDGTKIGKLNDNFWRAGVGFVFYLGKKL